MLGVYIHVPYCRQKCNYCDFYSQGGANSVPSGYVDAVKRDIQAAGGCLPLRPNTVYFGGGTPCLLTPLQVRDIISALCPPQGAEVTLEANPESVTAHSLEGYIKAGVNRLSLGAQTASDETLKILGRRHTSQQTRLALENARRVGFKNISGDIMLALPNYSTDEMKRTVEMLAGGGCVHISSYMLKTEKGTPFYNSAPDGLPNDDESADFYLQCVQELAKHGFEQYEISNFAQKGFESRHNLIYWTCEDYMGFGPAAHSSVAKKRFSNASDTLSFIERPPVQKSEGEVTHEDYIMLSLRLASGLCLQTLKTDWGYEFSKRHVQFCEKLHKEKLAVFENDKLKLTPKGMLLQQSILCEILDF